MKNWSILDWIALFYAFIAVTVAVRLKRAGKATFDTNFTAEDRRLAGAATFYLAIPGAVALHELGHALCTWAFGGTVETFHYMIYWGYVVPKRVPDFAHWQTALMALSGNLISLALGAWALLWALQNPKNAAWNYARLEFARILLQLTLFFYPAVSLLFQVGDFYILQQSLNKTWPRLGDVTLGFYGALALGFAWWWKRSSLKKHLAMLVAPLWDSRCSLEKELLREPDSALLLREHGRVTIALEDTDAALQSLARAAEQTPDDPHTLYLLGVAHLKKDHAQEAADVLRKAGELLDAKAHKTPEERALYYEVVLALSASRLALRDAEGAILTAEAAQEDRPGDPRGLLVHADALVAAGRKAEAKSRLEAALSKAEGLLAYEIRRRLEALP